CISKCGDLEAAKLNSDCYTANRSRLCRAHLIKCKNFVADYGEEEVERIKAISVPEDNKKRKSSKKNDNEELSSSNDEESTEANKKYKVLPSSSSSLNSRQQSIKNFVAKKAEQDLKRLHIATPIVPEEDETNNESEEQRWNSLINDWINMTEYKNQFDHSEDEIFLNSDWDKDFNFGGRMKHPADDNEAKWSLETLFTSGLEKPNFLN
ncbi:9786_t:CDS:2, partial [Racocetra fulgida]